MGKCRKIPVKVTEAAKILSSNNSTADEKSKAAEILNDHKKKQH